MNFLSARLPQTIRPWAAASAMSLPVSYIIYKHVSWKTNPASKRRMLIHQLTFWGMAGLALRFMHRSFMKFRRGQLKAEWIPVRILGAAGLLIAGFEGGERLARFLVPKSKNQQEKPGSRQVLTNAYRPVESGGTSVTRRVPLGKIYRPAYLDGG